MQKSVHFNNLTIWVWHKEMGESQSCKKKTSPGHSRAWLFFFLFWRKSFKDYRNNIICRFPQAEVVKIINKVWYVQLLRASLPVEFSELNAVSLICIMIMSDNIASCVFCYQEKLEKVIKFFKIIRLRKFLYIIVRLWVSTTKTSSWTVCTLIWHAWVFQGHDFFLYFQKLPMSFSRVQIVSLLNKSFSRVHLTSLPNIWRARINFFFSYFLHLRTATSTMQTGRLIFLRYQIHVGRIHYEYLTRPSISWWLFFFTFLKTCTPSPHQWNGIHHIIFFSF